VPDSSTKRNEDHYSNIPVEESLSEENQSDLMEDFFPIDGEVGKRLNQMVPVPVSIPYIYFQYNVLYAMVWRECFHQL